MINFLEKDNSFNYTASKDLLKNNADPDVQNNDSNTALIKAIRNGSLRAVKLLLKFKAKISIKNSAGDDALTMAIKELNKTADSLNEVEHVEQHLLKKRIDVFKELLKFISSDVVDIDSLLKEYSKIANNVILEDIADTIFNNQNILQSLIYENNNLNIERVLHILEKPSHFNRELLSKIIEKINIATLFSYDTFLMKSRSLLIESFINTINLYKLEEVNIVREINGIMINSLCSYHIEKINNIEGYEEKFLEKLALIKETINIFIGDLYLATRDSKKGINIGKLSYKLNKKTHFK